jgi:hypothetical protein
VLIPFLDGYGLVNIVLIAALVPLLRYDYDSIRPRTHRGSAEEVER